MGQVLDKQVLPVVSWWPAAGSPLGPAMSSFSGLKSIDFYRKIPRDLTEGAAFTHVHARR
jgi:hypothetical protein